MSKKVIGPQCTFCLNVIEEHPEEMHAFDGKPVCSDCYFEKLGGLVEKHPYSTRVGRFSRTRKEGA